MAPIRTARHAYLYLTMLPVLILLLHVPFTESAFWNGWFYYLLLLGFGIAIGKKDLAEYCRTVDGSWKRTAKIGLYLLLFKGSVGMLSLFTLKLFGITDPQGISNEYNTLSTFAQQESIVPFVAIAEECFKVLVLLGLLWIFRRASWSTRVLAAVVLASFIFGFVHSFEYSANAIAPIALGAVPTYYVLLRYRSMYPLIFTHFCWDTFFLAGQIHDIGPIISYSLQITGVLLALLIIGNRHIRTIKTRYKAQAQAPVGSTE